jgi:TPR repeat protein
MKLKIATVTVLMIAAGSVHVSVGAADRKPGEAATKVEEKKVQGKPAEQDVKAPGEEKKKEPEMDYAAAFKGLKPLAEKGDEKAQVQVAYLYYTGKGVRQDYKEAAAWFKKAAAKGNMTAQVNLGKMSSTGLGMKQDDAEAAKWFRKAADGKHADGQFSLGLAYLLGKGVPKDGKAAYMWVSLAADQGHDMAKRLIAQVGSEIAPGEAEAGKKMAKEWKPGKQ